MTYCRRVATDQNNAENADEATQSAKSVFPGFGAIAREPAPDLAAVVSLLGQRRRSLGMSQTSAVARLEAGTDDVRLSTLERYADAVNLTIGFTLETDQ